MSNILFAMYADSLSALRHKKFRVYHPRNRVSMSQIAQTVLRTASRLKQSVGDDTWPG